MSTPTRNTTVLGMPTVPGRGNLNELHPFPEVAKHELGNVQMRTNLRKATGTIRGTRLQRVAAMPDGDDLRDTAE
ncbi:MAG: (4Fe-4S)-binding protein, partial [Corynebacterium variabile]